MLQNYLNARPIIAERVYIHELSAVIGEVTISEDCSIWPGAVVRGDVNTISIGKRTNIQDQSVLHLTHKSKMNPNGFPLLVGSDVTIGHRVTCHGCQIADRVLLGIGSIILDGAYIPGDVIIGAHSLVPANKVLQSGYLYYGSPVQKIRPLTQQELEFLPYSAAHYVALKNHYLNNDPVVAEN